MDVDGPVLAAVGAELNGVDVSVVQFRGMAQKEGRGVAGANVLEEEGVLGVVLDVTPVGAAFAVPVAVVEHTEVVLPLLSPGIFGDVFVDGRFVELESLGVAGGHVVEDLGSAIPLGRRGGQGRICKGGAELPSLGGRET